MGGKSLPANYGHRLATGFYFSSEGGLPPSAIPIYNIYIYMYTHMHDCFHFIFHSILHVAVGFKVPNAII